MVEKQVAPNEPSCALYLPILTELARHFSHYLRQETLWSNASELALVDGFALVRAMISDGRSETEMESSIAGFMEVLRLKGFRPKLFLLDVLPLNNQLEQMSAVLMANKGMSTEKPFVSPAHLGMVKWLMNHHEELKVDVQNVGDLVKHKGIVFGDDPIFYLISDRYVQISTINWREVTSKGRFVAEVFHLTDFVGDTFLLNEDVLRLPDAMFFAKNFSSAVRYLLIWETRFDDRLNSFQRIMLAPPIVQQLPIIMESWTRGTTVRIALAFVKAKYMLQGKPVPEVVLVHEQGHWGLAKLDAAVCPAIGTELLPCLSAAIGIPEPELRGLCRLSGHRRVFALAFAVFSRRGVRKVSASMLEGLLFTGMICEMRSANHYTDEVKLVMRQLEAETQKPISLETMGLLQTFEVCLVEAADALNFNLNISSVYSYNMASKILVSGLGIGQFLQQHNIRNIWEDILLFFQNFSSDKGRLRRRPKIRPLKKPCAREVCAASACGLKSS